MVRTATAGVGGGERTPGAATGTAVPCPLDVDYWRTHPSAWRVDSLALGNTAYTKSELLAMLSDTSNRSAATILARPLIGAKLNIAAGFDPGHASASVQTGDELFNELGGRLPQDVDPAGWRGQGMLWTAAALAAYDNRCAAGASGSVLGTTQAPRQLPSTGNNPIMDERLRLSVITLVILILVALVLRGIVRDLRD